MKQTLRTLFTEPAALPAELNRTYTVYSCVPEQAAATPGAVLQEVSFADGKLYVDDRLIVEPTFGPRSVSWVQHTKDHYTTGHLDFTPNGIECTGTIAWGRSNDDHTLHHVFLAAVAPSVYTTQVSKQRHAADTDPSSLSADAWEQGLTLELGYKYRTGDPLPTLHVRMDEQDISEYVALNIAAGDKLQIILNLGNDDEALCLFDGNLYLSGTITFSTFGEQFTGQITATCSERTGTNAYLWTGTTGRARTPRSANRTDALTANDLLRTSSLHLGELITLVPDERVLNMNFNMLVENMKWSMGQGAKEKDWLRTFFNQQPPALDAKRQELIKKNTDWYQQQFAVGFLSYSLNGLSGTGAPTVKLTPEQEQKLNLYMTKGLAKSKEYALQMNGIYQQAYLAVKPRLQAYLKDDAEKWAQELYNFVTSSSQLNLLVNRVYGTYDMSASNHFATLLQVLDPSGEKARKYQEAVMSRVLLQASVQTSVLDEEVTLSWMPEALRVFAETYGTPDGTAREGQPANAAAEEQQKIAEAVKQAAEQMGGWTGLAKEFTRLLINAKGRTIIQQTESAAEAFSRAYPKLTTASRVLLLICMAGGVYSVTVSFLNWKESSTTQKVAAITSAVSLFADAAELTLAILEGRLNQQQAQNLNQWMGQPDVLENNSQIGSIIAEGADQTWQEVGATQTADLFRADAGQAQPQVQVQGTRWSKICSAASKVVSVIGIVVSAVFTVLSTIDFINDIKEGKPDSKKVIDGIMMVSNFVTTICLVVDLAFGLTVFAMAASIFAIIGLIVSLVSLFLPAPKEEAPTDKFMRETAKSFVDKLPANA